MSEIKSIYGNTLADTVAREDLNASEVMINLVNGRIKNVPIERSGAIGNLSVSYSYGRVTLNGSASTVVVLEADSDRITEDPNKIAYRQGINSGLIEDNTGCRKNPFTPGRYRLVFRMLSGTVTRNGVTYTSNEDFGTTNVVNAFLLKADATTSSYTLIKTNVTTEADLSVNEVGLQILYLYNGCVFDNAVFELYLEKVEPITDGIPIYWNEEIATSIEQIRSNIVSASGTESTTICFVTDCHWANNEKHSPAIIKKLFENCNINYFVNGGDLLYSHTTTKDAAIEEMAECINAFRGCGKPMITLYGNHDRNRHNNLSYPERLLSHSEHANVVFKSFMPNPNIHRITSDYTCFYWDDDVYRYACIYWYATDDATRANSFISELTNTTKPIVIFYHGIYITLAADTTDDVIDNMWILNAFEPYKAQIKCIIQGHTHRDGLRHAWGTVPIIVIDCDTINDFSTVGTITEQSVAVITLDTDKISVVKVGRGEDFDVTADSPDWRQEYTGGDQ